MSEHELWNELGNLYFMSGAYQQASYAYNRSIQMESRYGRPYSNLALANVQQGKYAEAVDLYRSSIELLTDDKEKAISWFRLGDVYRRLKDYRDAILAYQQADLLDPSLSQDEEAVGKVLYGASNLTSSTGQVPVNPEKIDLEIPDTVIADPPRLESTFEDLTNTTQTEQIEPSSEEAGPSLELEDPGEEIDTSQPDFSAVINEIPPEFAENAGPEHEEELPDWLLYPEAETPDESLSQWISNEHHEPETAMDYPTPAGNYPSPNYSASSSLPADSGQVAYSDRKDLMVIDVKQPITGFYVAPSEQDLSAPVETADETREAIQQVTPRDQNEEQDGIELEIEALRRSLQNDTDNAPAWDDLGELYKSIKIYKEAIPAYQQAATIDPKNIQYLYHLGCAYAIEGCSDEAVKTFQQIIKLDSGHALAHATLGGYYRKMGLEELAQKHIGKAVKNFYDSENEYNRACLQALCGNVEDAIELLRTALQTEQTYVDWVLRDPDLDTIRTDPRFKQLISDFS